MRDKSVVLSEEEKSEKLLRLLFTIFSIGVGVFSAFYLMTKGGDFDYLWHTVLSDYMWENKSLPVQDIYSWRSVEMGYTEIAHSWLGSFLLGRMVRLFTLSGYSPLMGGRAFSFICYLICVLTVRGTFFKGKKLWVYPVVCVAISVPYSNVRMQNLSYIILILILYILFEAKNWKWTLFLPILIMLCANIHGGTVILFIGIMLVYAVCQFVPEFSFGMLQHEPTTDKKLRIAYLGACAVSLLAVSVNPYGWKLYTYFMHVGGDNFSATHIAEWKPISSAYLVFKVMFIILLLIVLQRKQINLLRYGIVAGFSVLAWKYGRFTDYAVVCSVPLLVAYGESFVDSLQSISLSEKAKKAAGVVKKVLITIMLSASVIVPCFDLLVMSVALKGSLGETYVNRMLTDGVIEYLKEKDFQRPLNFYNEGAVLIYAGFPTFVDSRADLFVGEELQDAGKLAHQEALKDDLDAILDKYAFDAIILGSKNYYGFQNYMSGKEDWVIDYKDEQFMVYIPVETE